MSDATGILRRREVMLAAPLEPLQIKIPRDFKGQRVDPKKTEIWIVSGSFTVMTQDEIDLANTFLKKHQYRQRLAYGAVILDPKDPLWNAAHDQLDEIEAYVGLENTRYASHGGTRQVKERVIMIREKDYWGTGEKALSAAA